MSATQTEMDLRTGEAAKVSAEEVRALEDALFEAGDWITSRLFPLPWSDRKLRAVANASGGRVISGQRGYKLTRLATIEEVQHAAAWLRHQAGEMQRRAMEIDRVYHGKTHWRRSADATG